MKSEISIERRNADLEIASINEHIRTASDNLISMGSGEVMNIRQQADNEVTTARAQAQFYENEVRQLRNEPHPYSLLAPTVDTYTPLVCELDQARTEVRDRQQHVSGLSVMLRSSEDLLKRAPSRKRRRY